MNKTILTSCFALLIAVSANAVFATQSTTKVRGNNNPITVHNKTDTDIAYIMNTFSFSNTYAIKRGKVDVYHSKYGDEYLTVVVAPCKRIENGVCMELDPQNLHNCVNNAHYNGNLIDTIMVNSLDSCTVTCLDGGTTSCKQSG
jgi:hypothetical protein